MTFGSGDPQVSPTPALTRRELRERERAADTNQPVPGPSAAANQAVEHRDGMQALFGAPVGGNTFVPSAPNESAARLAFTPTTPSPGTPQAPRLAPSPRAPRGTQIATNQSTSARPKRIARTVGSRMLSVGALVFAGALAFGMSVPANAFYTPSSAMAAENADVVQPKALQTVEVAANVESATATRDKFSVLSWAEVLKERYGTRNFDYRPGNGTIRWPFPQAVPISSGYGERIAPCRGCSSHHMGVDFTPGAGSAIFVIADGVVTEARDDANGFGNHVIITHHINGHVVTTLYAHMQHGSSPLFVGEEVKVGDFIGLVGQTGTATGAHLHLEITVDGPHVDPFAWLKANAN
jgi:murein DD-endopeptidase MepM/ murein hydrolase activator NlpD